MADPNIRLYAEVVKLWSHRMDTFDIARRLDLEQSTVANWVANFRDVTRERASA